MKYYIYNPLARNGTGIDNTDTSAYYDCTNNNQMSNLESKLNKDDTITIIGGDGTLNYLLNNYSYLHNFNLELFANGSGNDFARSLKDDSYYYTLNNEFSFVNTFGIGFDAVICNNVNNSTKKNKLSYLIEAYKGIKKYKPFSLEIKYNNKIHKYNNVWLCSLQNGNYFGGGINIANKANIKDEHIDLCIAHDLNRLGVLFLLLFVKLGLVHYFKKYFFTIKTKDILIFNNKNRLVQLDGDTKYINTDITLTAINHMKIKKVNKL